MKKTQNVGKVNQDLFIMTFKEWKIFRITEGLYYYRKETAALTAAGMTPEGIDYGSDKEAFIAALEDIENIDAQFSK